MSSSTTYPMVLGSHVPFSIKHGMAQLCNEIPCLLSIELLLSSLIFLLQSACLLLRIQFNLAYHITIWMWSVVNCFIFLKSLAEHLNLRPGKSIGKWSAGHIYNMPMIIYMERIAISLLATSSSYYNSFVSPLFLQCTLLTNNINLVTICKKQIKKLRTCQSGEPASIRWSKDDWIKNGN